MLVSPYSPMFLIHGERYPFRNGGTYFTTPKQKNPSHARRAKVKAARKQALATKQRRRK